MTSGLNTKDASIIELLTATNEKLDTVITLLGGVPPTPTATMDDLLAVLQDIHTDTMSMDGKLLTIRDAITDDVLPVLTDIHTDTTSMDGKLLSIRNLLFSPDEDAIPDDSSISWNLFILRAAVATASYPAIGIDNVQLALSKLYSLVYYSATNLGLNVIEDSQEYTGYLFDVLNWLGLLSGATGLPIEAGNRDVIQLLAKIADRPESQIGSGLAAADLCEDAYVSTGMTLVPSVFDAYPSIVYAIFPSPAPSPLSFGTVFGIGIDNTELVISGGDWFGWGIYVASSAANFGLFVGGDADQSLARYPTNVWVDIGFYAYNLSVYVGGSDSLKVYLCSGSWGGGSSSGGPWGGGSSSSGLYGFDFTSERIGLATRAGTKTEADLVMPPDGIEGTTSITFAGFAPYVFLSPCVFVMDAYGYTVELLSGATMHFNSVYPDGSSNYAFTLTTPGDNHTISSHTEKFIFNGGVNAGDPDGEFTIRFTPPA